MKKRSVVKGKPKDKKSGKVRKHFFTSSTRKEIKEESNSSLPLKLHGYRKEFRSGFPNMESLQSALVISSISPLPQKKLGTLHSSIPKHASLPKQNAKNCSSNAKEKGTLVDQTPNKGSKIKHEEEKEGCLQREEEKQPEEIPKYQPVSRGVLCRDPFCLKEILKSEICCQQEEISERVIEHAETGDESKIDELEKLELERVDDLEMYDNSGKFYEDCGKYHEGDIEGYYQEIAEAQAEGAPELQLDMSRESCSHSMHLKETIRKCLVALQREIFELVYSHEEVAHGTRKAEVDALEHQRNYFLKILGDVVMTCKGNASVFSLRLD
ncbi:unnamed protein product [Moneuplotes crassus]|uniref:Uncharacterized protein n=1 Tax=Euplotes crassus TaxID=5936 RepID=A0AAD1XEN9_EUPCR|nr:unnamed protein product [Moneuplotes crassus]